MASDATTTTFRVQQIDHVEVFVPNRREAAHRLEVTTYGAREVRQWLAETS